ncbi:hypothetical protein ABIE44_000562 [Marmoricola sp. OAE513]|uniref:beta strand repeat-containing protein n=1 Tax=Marmoricola sp. OAE513 TaxID=2817894 RepID=UPI001AE14FAC
MRARVHTSDRPKGRARRGLTGLIAVFSLCAAALVAVGAAPANAVQASGDDVPAWNNGWSWTYQTSFRYVAEGTDVTINETATYTVAGRETFRGQDAYKLNLSGTINNGSGTVAVPDVGNATLKNFSGNVSGTRYVRVADLALLQENQQQHLNATASIAIISTGIVADINLSLTPRDQTWKVHNFPLNVGDKWDTNTNVDYEGGFSYDAGSLGGTGNSPFGPDTMVFSAPNTAVTAETITVPIASNLNTKKVTAVNADNTMSDQSWWSVTHRNQAKEILVLPLDGGSITLTRNLQSASLPGGAQFSATTTPSLTCAGSPITVSGNLSTNQAGVPVTVRIDKSQKNGGTNPGEYVQATTTTGVNGAYSVNLTAPSESDLQNRNSGPNGTARASWGIEVISSATTATGASTVVVTPVDCSSISYTGATSGPNAGSANVSAQLTNLAGGSAAGRTVTFALSGGGSVSAVTNGSGVASASLPLNGPVRAATITASVPGSSNFAAASTSAPFSVLVNPTTTTVAPSNSTVTIGDPITFDATITPVVGSNPGGTVQFLVNGAALGGPVAVSGNTASVTVNNTGAIGLGNHTVQAVYNGSALFGTSSSPTVPFRIRVPLLGSTASLSVTPNSTVYGQGVTLSSHITTTSGSGNPTGTVTFKEGGTVYGSAPVNGSGDASIVVTDIPVGAHSITASYSGDDEYNSANSSPGSLNVAKADVTVTATTSDSSTVTGEAVDFGVSVAAVAPGAGLPDGTVQLVVDGNNVGAPVALVGGVANFDPVTSLKAGNHTVAVAYSGSSNYKTGNDTLSQSVTKADTATVVTISPSPSSEDQNVNITANVGAVAPGGGAATGLVSFTADGDPIGSAPLNPSSGGAAATLQISTLAPGTHTIVATYDGDDDYNGSVSPGKNHTVIEGAAIVATKTTVVSSQNPSVYGEFVSFTATVVDDDEVNDGPDGAGDVPEGAVQFSIDGTDVGIPVEVGPDGTATSPLVASPEPGDHTVIAAFIGSPGWGNGGDFLAQSVEDASVGLTVTSSNASSNYGQAVTFKAKATTPVDGIGNPDGHVQFRVDGVAVGGAVALDGDGEATSNAVSNLTPGTHTVTADYSGSAHFAPALASTTQNVGKVGTTTALVAAPSTVNFGQTVALMATVTPAATALGAPTGTVTFKDGSTVLGTSAVGANGTNGKAVLSVSNLQGGTHSITATYSGSAGFSGSVSSAQTVTVNKLNTTITARGALVNLVPLQVPLGHLQATLTSANGPVVGAPVKFTIGTATVCTSYTDANGLATCNALPQLLTLTLLGFKASYAGDGNYNPSTVQGTILK